MDYTQSDELVRWYTAVENSLLDIFEYIQPIKKNYMICIPKVAPLILECGSLIDTIHSMLKVDNEQIFNFYIRKYNLDKIKSVLLFHPITFVSPFSRCFIKGKYKEPKWWKAYNGLKHSRMNNVQLCNIKNAIEIVCALHQVITQEKEFFNALLINGVVKTDYNIDYVISDIDKVYEEEKTNGFKSMIFETKMFYSELGIRNKNKDVYKYGNSIRLNTKLRNMQLCTN